PSYGGQQAVRIGDWKGVRQEMHKGRMEIALYDLARDPGERTDVAAAHPDVVGKMRAIMSDAHTPSKLFRFKAIDA
ncbi:MAG: arylsulfatase, partial [Planctomycetota bacterium]